MKTKVKHSFAHQEFSCCAYVGATGGRHMWPMRLLQDPKLAQNRPEVTFREIQDSLEFGFGSKVFRAAFDEYRRNHCGILSFVSPGYCFSGLLLYISTKSGPLPRPMATLVVRSWELLIERFKTVRLKRTLCPTIIVLGGLLETCISWNSLSWKTVCKFFLSLENLGDSQDRATSGYD